MKYFFFLRKFKKYPTKSITILTVLFAATFFIPRINYAEESSSNKVFCSHLPILLVEPDDEPFPTLEGNKTDEELKAKRKVTIEVFDANPKDELNGRLNCLSNKTVNQLATMHYRGASSLRFPKHQFSLKLSEAWDLSKNPALKTPHFLGMPFGGKSWVLSAEQPNLDGTYLRNTLSFYLHRKLGELTPNNTTWAPRTRFFELVIQEPKKPLNIQKEYTGLHVLAEAIEFAKHRVYPNPEYPSMLYKIDLPKPGDRVVTDNVNNQIVVQDLLKVKLDAEKQLPAFWQEAFSLWAKSVDPMLYSGDEIHDTVNIDGKQETVIINSDEDSFAIAFLLNEFIKDPDGYNRNTFMVQSFNKENNTLTMSVGPSWDKNLAYDLNLPQSDFPQTGGFTGYGKPYAGAQDWTFGVKHKFWKDLLHKASVQAKICHYWFKAKETNTLNAQAIMSFLDNKTTWITDNNNDKPVARDCNRYFPNTQCANEYAAKVTLLKDYIKNRLDWMNTELGVDEADCKTKLKAIIIKESGY